MEAVVEKKCPSCKSMHVENTKCCASCIVKAKARYDLKKEEILQKSKEDRIKNPDKYKKIADTYRETHRVEINERQKQKYVDDPTKNKEANIAFRNSRRGMLKSIHKGARDRNLVISMTDEEIMNMTDLNCVYCNTETKDMICRNGLDRIDSSLGYDLSNCVPCCGSCNMSKGQLDPLTFIERNKQISFNHGGIGEITNNWSNISKEWYNRYKNRMIKKGKIFDLTREDFDSIRASKCVYCGRSSTSEHSNGIDCLSSDKGYIISNCVTSCKDCNFMKRMQTYEDFISKSKKISVCSYVFNVVNRVTTTFVKK